MAQLNAPVTDIQLKSDMLTSAKLADLTTDEAKAAAWTDMTYPSAKAVVDQINKLAPDKIEHPIGSVLITATNETPATKVGGTWELIDKEYQAAVSTNTYWTPGMSGSTPIAEASGFVIHTDHLIHLYAQITTKVAISVTNSYTVGSFDHDMIGGVPNTPISFGYSDSNFANAVYTNNSSTESCTIRYGLGWDGTFTIYEIFNTTKQLPVNTLIYLNTSIKMDPEYMGDSFCDKFYWKRTA